MAAVNLKKEIIMKNVRLSLLAVACIATSSLAFAAPADEHAAHHPDAASTPVAGGAVAKAKANKPKAVAASPVDQQMQAMHAMHEKMMNAKSMDERRAMLDEQMKSMESGMAMMDQMGMGGQSAAAAASGASASSGMSMGGGMAMGSAGMPAQHASMMKRMEMMQMMMRMMMDRLSIEPAK
jgi:hypothetical protein